MKHYDVIIIGAGAAGLMCAAIAGQRGKRVAIIDHANQVGAKILISGGGRCNFTNLNVLPKCFISENPHFAKSALSRYTQHDFIALVEKYGIAYHEKTLGQLFCDGSARTIVAMLLEECARGAVDIHLQHSITNVSHHDHFKISTHNRMFTATSLVLASGGLSIPKMGATGLAYDIAHNFGMRCVTQRPALVPLTTPQHLLPTIQSLAGIAVDATAHLQSAKFREHILYTHRGLSGPAILQISSYWRPGDSITLNLLPDNDLFTSLKDKKHSRPKAELKTLLSEYLPSRLAQALAQDWPAQPIANFSDIQLKAIAHSIHAWAFTPSGSEGYAKAEVTAGGIDTRDLSSKTMESTTLKNLYAIGEAVDVTGWLGGYNFQWAWSSGWVAGQSV